MNILVTMPKGEIRDTFIPNDVASRIEAMGNVIWNETEEQFSEDELKDKIKDIDLCITGWGCKMLDKNILDNATKLKIIAHTGGTVATLVDDSAYDKGIKVISGNYLFAESVAEGVIAYMLAALRKIPYFANEMQAGVWKNESSYGSLNEGLLDQTIGLVGFGMITKILVKMLEPFRVKIKVFSKHITDETLKEYNMKKASLEEIFTTCKIISIHSAKRPDTFHMINKELLEMIPDDAIFVNTARGAIIDEEALADELAKERFKAILDVYEVEPLPADSRLKGHKNTILMPHMGGPTLDRRGFITRNLLDDIEGFYNGEALKYEISREYAAIMTR